jgi:hypothetical protein
VVTSSGADQSQRRQFSICETERDCRVRRFGLGAPSRVIRSGHSDMRGVGEVVDRLRQRQMLSRTCGCLSQYLGGLGLVTSGGQ